MSFKRVLNRLNRRDLPLIPKISAKTKITVFFLMVLISIPLTKHILAQADTQNILRNKLDAIEEGGNQEKWLDEALSSNTISILDTLADLQHAPDEILEGRLIDKNGKPIVWIPGGTVGTLNNVVAQLYYPPASGIQYIANTWDDLIGKPAYAQTVIGFRGIQPILPLWKSFRNIVYILSTFIFIIMGIMIMLRVKISPQAVITIQNAIPSMITTLILVTFSYAIIGLLIDLSYFVQAFVVALVMPNLLSGSATGFLSQIFASVPILRDVTANFYSLSTGNIFILIQSLMIPAFMTTLAAFIIGFIVSLAITLPLSMGNPLIAIATGPISLGIASMGTILVLLILLILLIIWIIKFILGLFKVYITLIFQIIFAPLVIGMGAIPGSKVNFNSWLWDTIANLSVFPISFIFLILSNHIIVNLVWGGFSGSVRDIFSGNITGGGMWTPGILGGDLAEVGLRGIGGIAPLAIGIGTLLILSKLPEMIPQVIFAIKPSPWGTAIGQALDVSRNPFFQAAKTSTTSMGITTGTGIVNKYGQGLLNKSQSMKVTDPAEAERIEKRGKIITGIATGVQRAAYQGKLTTSDDPGSYGKG